jgi:uncharacterized membrane protein
MSWQLLIWNIFVWLFTGVMIYVTNSALWWLLLPAFFTATQSASDLVKAVNKAEKEEEDFEVDEEIKEKMRALFAKMKRGSL